MSPMRTKACTNDAERAAMHDVGGEREIAAGAGSDAVHRGRPPG